MQTRHAPQASTIVGYDETGLRFGSKGVGASFVNVGAPTTAINIQDIAIAGYDPVEGSGADVTAQTLDEYGRTLKEYTWYDIPGEYYGWFDEEENLVEGVLMQPGETLSFSAPDSTYYVNFPSVEIK